MKRTVVLAALLVATSAALANDVDPFGFEKEHSQSSMSRAEAVAQARAAKPAAMRIDDQGRLITTPSTKSRAQVVAETVAAAKMGLIRHGELGPVEATEAQQRAITLAGQRAGGRAVDVE